MSIPECWSRRSEVERMGHQDPLCEAFELVPGFDAGAHAEAYRAVVDSLDAERKGLAPMLVFEAWAAGYTDTEPADFVKAAKELHALGYSSLLDCAQTEGAANLPAKCPPRLRTAAKKWLRQQESVEGETARRRKEEAALRPAQLPRRILDVDTQLELFGLSSLPDFLKPTYAQLNAFQKRGEEVPDLLLPFVDVSRPPFSQEGWTHGGETEEKGFVLSEAGVLQRKEARGREDAPISHLAVSLQRLLVAAALTGALGPSPLVFVFAYPAVVTNIACRYRLQVAKEYDRRMRGVQLASAKRPRQGEQLAAGVVRDLTQEDAGVLIGIQSFALERQQDRPRQDPYRYGQEPRQAQDAGKALVVSRRQRAVGAGRVQQADQPRRGREAQHGGPPTKRARADPGK
ncbi:hypothetical protein DIPPA_01821 [Diplonema papillatum]|nr:hypothetical protein DIPPA_01821 [Diplonema papillatum]